MIQPDLIEHVIRPVVPDAVRRRRLRGAASTRPARSSSAARTPTPASPAARSSSTPTAAWPATAAARSRGKDPSKVDRSAAYAARWVAKHVVASGAATRCEVQVAYAIGVAHPVSILVETFGTDTVDPEPIEKAVQRGVRPAPGGHHPRPRPAPADLPQDRGLRPLRPVRRRSSPGSRLSRLDDFKAAVGLA